MALPGAESALVIIQDIKAAEDCVQESPVVGTGINARIDYVTWHSDTVFSDYTVKKSRTYSQLEPPILDTSGPEELI